MGKEPLIPISRFNPDLQTHPLTAKNVLEALSRFVTIGLLGNPWMMGFRGGVVLKGKKNWGCAVASIGWGGGQAVTEKGC